MFTPIQIWEIIQFDYIVFAKGWFNHQLDSVGSSIFPWVFNQQDSDLKNDPVTGPIVETWKQTVGRDVGDPRHM